MPKVEKRKGVQTPTRSRILPYQKTKGLEAIELYNRSKRTAMPWQELQMCDMMAVDDSGLWVHMTYGYAVPRRNGKSELLVARELWGLENGEKILHTAHLASTSHASWERLKAALDASGYVCRADVRKSDEVPIEKQYISYKAKGSESIKLCKDGGGMINFRTRTSTGGLGEGYDLLIIDEAQEYTIDQESSLQYVVTASANPQTIMCGTPPTAVSSGTVFKDLRTKIFEGEQMYAGWAEWGVSKITNPNDVEAWYKTNPSLGYILQERNVVNENKSDEIDFNIQRLGLWLAYNQKSAISENEWNEMKVDELPNLRGKLFVGIKYGHDGTNVAMAIACKTYTDEIFVQAVDCRPVREGNRWIYDFLKKSWVNEVVIDGAGQDILKAEIKEARIRTPLTLPTVKEVIASYSMFERGIEDRKVLHACQPSLDQLVTNCEKRAIGHTGGWGYKAINIEMESALLDSVVLAYWKCLTSKEPKKQRIRC